MCTLFKNSDSNHNMCVFYPIPPSNSLTPAVFPTVQLNTGSDGKKLPAMQEMWVWFLGWEDTLEKGMATLCNILVWKIPWTEEPGGLESMGLQRVGHDWAHPEIASDSTGEGLCPQDSPCFRDGSEVQVVTCASDQLAINQKFASLPSWV